jgi:hypothetical protein
MRGMHHPIQLLLLEKVSHKLFAWTVLKSQSSQSLPPKKVGLKHE